MTRMFWRATLVILVAAITVLSVVPPAWRPTTAASHQLEHLLIFAATGLAMALALSWRWWMQIAVLGLFAVAIETAQLFVPGRHARLSDLAVNIFGACLGIGVAHLVATFSRAKPAGAAVSGPAPR